MATVAMLVPLAAPRASATTEEQRQDLSENREAQEDLGAAIEHLELSIAQLEAALVELDVELGRLALDLARSTEHLAATRREVTEAYLAVAQAVVREIGAEAQVDEGLRSAYVSPPSDATGSYLLATDGADAGRRIVLVGAMVAQRQDELDLARQLRADRRAASDRAANAEAAATAARARILELRTEVGRIRAEHTHTLLVKEQRLEELHEEVEALAEEEAAITQLIRRLEAEATRAAGTPPSALIWPAAGWISSEFGPRWGRNHNGIDIAGPTGTPVRAAANGVVTHAGPMGSFGNLVIIDHSGGVVTLYAHLHSIHVSVDQSVSVNQQVATIGSTGRSTGPHLHFEVRRRGTAVNPRTMLR